MKKLGFLKPKKLLYLSLFFGAVTVFPRACDAINQSIFPVAVESIPDTPAPTLNESLNYYTTITLPNGGELLVTQVIDANGVVYTYAGINGQNLQIDNPLTPINPDQTGQSNISFLLPQTVDLQAGTTSLLPGTVISVNDEEFLIYVPEIN